MRPRVFNCQHHPLHFAFKKVAGPSLFISLAYDHELTSMPRDLDAEDFDNTTI